MTERDMDAQFVRAATMALLRIQYGADKVDFIDEKPSGLAYKINDEVRYVSLQLFNYEDHAFYCNTETFSGEDNVMTFHPYGIRMFKVTKVKPLLTENKRLAVKMPNGDIKVPFSVVSGVVKEIKFGN